MYYCIETHKRIKVSLAAYAYEVLNSPIMSDAEYDNINIDVSLNTNNKQLDIFFKNEYNSYTSQWIYKHPELDKIIAILNKYY